MVNRRRFDFRTRTNLAKSMYSPTKPPLCRQRVINLKILPVQRIFRSIQTEQGVKTVDWFPSLPIATIVNRIDILIFVACRSNSAGISYGVKVSETFIRVEISDMENVADMLRKLRMHEFDSETHKQSAVYFGLAINNVALIRQDDFLVDPEPVKP